MLRFLAFLFVLFFIVPYIFRVLGSMFRNGFDGNNKQSQQQRQSSQKTRQQTSQKKKVFPKNEGEYVDYEEIK